MPTILTPHGWVKVAAPPPRRRLITPEERAERQAEALRNGPLAYFAGRLEKPEKHIPVGNIPGITNRPKEAFPYDLNLSPEKLKRANEIRASESMSVKYRTVSEPVPVNIEVRVPREVDEPAPGPLLSLPKSIHEEDTKSVSSRSSRSSKTSSTRSESPSRSYHRHRHHSPSRHSRYQHRERSRSRERYTSPYPERPVTFYHTQPPMYHPPPHAAPGYGYYNAPPPSGYDRPPPPSSAKSMSSSWYNATTPLNLR